MVQPPAGEPQTAVDAEHAFAADAQTIGQWTAFRKWATADAMMFVPAPVRAQEWLKDRPEPPRAVRWQPATSFVSCDGEVAANTGPWQRPDGSVGYFSTIWGRQSTGAWRWRVDSGDALSAPRPAPRVPTVRRAACGTPSRPVPEIAFRCAPVASDRGGSADGSLRYYWYVTCGGGARSLLVWLWNGSAWEQVISDNILMPPAP